MQLVKERHMTAEELLLDESFIAWYHERNNPTTNSWNEWIALSPEHQQTADEAIRLFMKIHLKEKSVTIIQIDTAMDRVLEKIRNKE